MLLEHEGRTIECHVLKGIPVTHVLCHDFLMCRFAGNSHIVMRESTDKTITLWDCDAHGHVYSKGALVDVARPDSVKGDRAWPPGFGSDDDDEEEALSG